MKQLKIRDKNNSCHKYIFMDAETIHGDARTAAVDERTNRMRGTVDFMYLLVA
jgi:hypothetical protein